MSINREETWRILTAHWQDGHVRTLPIDGGPYAIISDLHLGDGGAADDFRHNPRALQRALDHYLANNYTLILLGDVEEFWQFDLHHITSAYDATVYQWLRRFGKDRIFRIFGNHDHEWGGLTDPSCSSEPRGATRLADEAIKLTGQGGNPLILLVHGHQGSLESDKYTWISRFFVRAFKPLEPLAKWIGLYGQGDATKSQIPRDYERCFHMWAEQHKAMIVCGHSHRAIFGSQAHSTQLKARIKELKVDSRKPGLKVAARRDIEDEIALLQEQLDDEREKGRVIEDIDSGPNPLPCYFNSGCGLYTDGLTAIEIADDQIRLVKWCNDTIVGPERQVFREDKLSSMLARIAAS
jgi:UDP-2,3-diacylglucosamine pyrophosphatase LpxH